MVDSGYPNRQGYLAPYKGTKYHLQEFRLGTMPRGIRETFNYAHSSIRNAVERSFGVLKNKWRMLKGIPSFPLQKQTKIIVACMTLHNFVSENDDEDEDFNHVEQSEYYTQENDFTDDIEDSNFRDDIDADMNAFRDRIAHDLYSRH